MVRDLTAASAFLLQPGEERVAVYRKLQTASKAIPCDDCGEGIQEGDRYLRMQLVNEKPGEDLNDRHQARSVDFQRRVVLRLHPSCSSPQGPTGTGGWDPGAA